MKPRRPRTGSIYLRGRTYWIKYYRRGQAFRESAKTDSYQEAERQLKRRQGELVTGKFAGLGPERIRIAELFADVVQDYEVGDKGTLEDLNSRLKHHLGP